MNTINEKEKESELKEEAEKNQDRRIDKQVPSRVAHRQVNVHGVAQGGAPNVYNLDHEGYLLGLANRTHSMNISFSKSKSQILSFMFYIYMIDSFLK